LLVILLDGGNVALVEAATAEDADTVVVVEGADTRRFSAVLRWRKLRSISPCVEQAGPVFLYRVVLVQLIRFLVVKLTHLDLNPKFDMGVASMANYSFSGR
jgi:hypothetical protein